MRLEDAIQHMKPQDPRAEESKGFVREEDDDECSKEEAKKYSELIRYRQSSPSFDGDDVASISDNSNEGADIGEESLASAIHSTSSHHTRFNVKQRTNLTEKLTPYLEAFIPVHYKMPEKKVCGLSLREQRVRKKQLAKLYQEREELEAQPSPEINAETLNRLR